MYKKKKRKYEKKKIIYISLFVVFIIVGFVVNIMVTERNLTIFEKAIKDSVISIEKIISYPINLIVDKIDDNKSKKEMFNDYQKLKEENEMLKIIATKTEELEFQINEMKKILELNSLLSDIEYINATIIGRNLDYWNDTIAIDKGEYNGININMPVVVGEGLIGKVIKTSEFTSTIRLLTASSTDKISVKVNVGNDYVYGILKRSNDKYIIEGIPQNVQISPEAVVTTTGMGDIFPSGIVVGKVVGITTDVFDLEKVLEIESLVDFDNLHYVVILKRNES